MTDIIQKLTAILRETIEDFHQKGFLKNSLDITENNFGIPRERWQGELTTPVLIKAVSDLPREELLQKFCGALTEKHIPFLKKVEPVPPGHLNFFLFPEVLQNSLKLIVEKKGSKAENIGGGKKVLLEFVSANPTGPLTIAHGRQAAYGEALARILAWSGYRVTREYYLNDEGRQIELLGQSLKVRCHRILGKDLPIPEDGYQGEYLVPIAQKLVAEFGPAVKDKEAGFFVKVAVENILEGIKRDLLAFGVTFDSYQSQRELSEKGLVTETLRILEESGATYLAEDALFLKTTSLGDDKDRVLRKKDGTFTYLAPDLAYHRVKFQKGYDLMVDVVGPDHHGYVSRLKAGVSLLGFAAEKVQVVIVQLTTLFRGKEKLKMSTRQGEFLPLSLLTEELSPDVAKFFFLSRKVNSHLDFDLQLAKKDSSENPVFYLQYATARVASLFRHQKEKLPDVNLNFGQADLRLLNEPEELEIMLLLTQFSPSVLVAARGFDPQILLTYLLSMVKVFHQYYQKCQIVVEDENLTAARLCLVSGLEIVLKEGLFLLNVYAPERM